MSPASVQLPSGIELPVTADVVQLLALAGCVARRDGRDEVDVEDLTTVLGELLPTTALPPRPGPDVPGPRTPVAVVTPYRDGPYLLRGAFELTDQDGHPIPTRRATVALCRCGRSQLRPFCDGTHKLTGFQADSGAECSTAADGE
ncbi:MAG TPA: CDGSH iron-sulfur domain-containing protein [Conexibacter sp.]|nr:CDGSH iron-sulfur domain-containing protein [Conexibacter sp.]